MPPTNETVQAIGAGIAAFLIALGTWWGAKRGDGKPPADRAPAPHEVREALAELRRLVRQTAGSRRLRPAPPGGRIRHPLG